MTRIQLSSLERSVVWPMVIPNISTRSWNWIPSGVIDSSHTPTDSVFDFWVFKRALVARSYRWTASLIVLNAARLLTKTFTYVITGVLRCRPPNFTPGSESSRERRRGWIQNAYKTILRGQPCRIPLRIAIGPARFRFICTDAVACSYSACILSTNQWIIPCHLRTLNRYWWDMWSKAPWKSSERIHRHVSVVSYCARTSWILASAFSMELPGTP